MSVHKSGDVGPQLLPGCVHAFDSNLRAFNSFACSAPASRPAMAPEGLLDLLGQEFFSDPTHWWDNRRIKKTPWHVDFGEKRSEDAVGVIYWYKPAGLCSRLDMWDATIRKPPLSLGTSVQGACDRSAANDGDLDAATCMKLFEDIRLVEAVDTLQLLAQRGCDIPNNLFYRVLKRCTEEKDLVLGRRIHGLTVRSGYEGNAFLATHLIGLYASHGKLEEAMRVFDKVRPPSAHNWAAMIFAYARHGEPTKAVELYRKMLHSGVKPDRLIFVAVLKACATARDLGASKDVHAHILATAGGPDMFVQTCLVDVYAKCGSLEDARRVFDRVSHRNVVTWNAMIAGYAQQGLYQEAISLHSSMQQDTSITPNAVTFTCLLQACASVGEVALRQGKQLHAQVEERGLGDDVVVGSSLVNMYAKCGGLEDARKVFDTLSQRNMVTWTAMIAGYAQHGMGQEALNLYSSLQKEFIDPPDTVTYVCLLQACATAAALPLGKQLHAKIEEQELQDHVVIGSSLVNMYAKCGSVETAQRVFDRLPQRNVVSWNAMIAGYTQQGLAQEALTLYTTMQQEGQYPPSSVTFVCLLQACASLGAVALHEGKCLHAQIEERRLQDDLVVGASLVNMYTKCGTLDDARSVFDRLPQRNGVTWTTLIAGYAQQGLAQEALNLYSAMQLEGLDPPDSVTFVCLLQACATAAALPLGKQLHAQIKDRGLQSDEVVGRTLVNMYAKCGSLEDAQQVFDSLVARDVLAWSALIAGYSCRGDSETVFNLVGRMRQEGVHPNSVTFLSLLTVCSHVGLVDKGRMYFEAMSRDYDISPTIEHYTCMMDLLGRAGHLDEALQMAKTMPLQPTAAVWLTLLAACRKWSNVDVGLQAFEFAVRLDEQDAAPYVLMSNIYAGAEMWEDAKQMQARRKKCGAWKQPGQTWCTDMGGVEHMFVVAGKKDAKSQFA